MVTVTAVIRKHHDSAVCHYKTKECSVSKRDTRRFDSQEGSDVKLRTTQSAVIQNGVEPYLHSLWHNPYLY